MNAELRRGRGGAHAPAWARPRDVDLVARSLGERFYAFCVVALPPVLIAWAAFSGCGLEHRHLSMPAFAAMYAFTGLGISLGYHRLLSHGSYDAAMWFRYLLAVAGTAACQGYFFTWVADHRAHHRYSDRHGDPHSPYVATAELHELTWRGFIHAHIGWMFGTKLARSRSLVPDLSRDPVMRFIDRGSIPIAAVSLVLPAAVVLAIGGTAAAIETFIWSGPVRVFCLNHVTWMINSIGHTFGTQDFLSGDQSRNSRILGPLAFGEGWHNGHHAFPRSARHGLLAGQLDASYSILLLLRRLGVVWNIRAPTPAEIEARRCHHVRCRIPLT
jgi:stearoyl-CoA desaturase (Delta-9 desaturase)